MECAAIFLLCIKAWSIIAVCHLAKNLSGVQQLTALILIKSGATAANNYNLLLLAFMQGRVACAI